MTMYVTLLHYIQFAVQLQIADMKDIITIPSSFEVSSHASHCIGKNLDRCMHFFHFSTKKKLCNCKIVTAT
jgi:hypothetical protein